MPEQNIESQPEPQKNPTREGEKRFSEGEPSRRDPEVNPGELDKKEIDLDRYGVSNAKDDESLGLSGDEESDEEISPDKTQDRSESKEDRPQP